MKFETFILAYEVVLDKGGLNCKADARLMELIQRHRGTFKSHFDRFENCKTEFLQGFQLFDITDNARVDTEMWQLLTGAGPLGLAKFFWATWRLAE